MFRFTLLIICAIISNIQTNDYYRQYRNPGLSNIYNDRVSIHLYYEAFCPECRKFDTTVLKTTVEELGPYLDINLIPYGNAKTIHNGGNYDFICQHGPEECYGNMLHACAINLLNNMTSAVIFNSCMMDMSQPGQGSNDAAADMCGATLSVDSQKIKQCAKGFEGKQLLKYYGELSQMVGFKYVPYLLINGVLNSGENFKQDICNAFRNPPPACKNYK